LTEKISSYIEKDCFEKSQNYCSTCDRTAELNIHLDDPVSTKTVRRELHKSNIHGRAAIAKHLITESNAQMRKRWCHYHKTWTSDIWKLAHDLVRWVVLHAVPYARKSSHFWRTPKEAYNPECLVLTVKHRGGSVMVGAAIWWYSILLVPLLPFMSQLL
jgi:hypothetical protein